MPYKALDNLFDALARYLKGLLPRGRVQRSCRRTWRTWPGCSPSCRGCRRSPRPAADAADLPDPQELRRRAFAGLRELLERLAREGPPGPGGRRPPVGRRRQRDPALGPARLAAVAGIALPGQLPVGGRRRLARSWRDLQRSIAGQPGAGASRAGRRGAHPVGSPRAGPGPAGPRRSRSRGAGARGRARVGGQSALHRRAGQAHPGGRARSTAGKRSAGSTWTRCSGSGSSASRRTRSGCWAPSPSPAGRSARPWPSRPPSWDAGGRVALASLRTARLIRLIGQARPGRDRDLPRPDPRDRVGPPAGGAAALASRAAGAGAVGRRPGATRSYWPGTIAGRATRRGPATITRAGPTRRRRRWRSTMRRGSTGRRWSCTRGSDEQARPLRKKLGDALANAGRGAEAAQAYLNAASLGPVGRDPRAEAAGFDSAPDQRARRRGAGAVAHAARPAGHPHARDARTGDAVAALASGDRSGSAACGSARAREPRSRPWIADADRPLLVGRRGAEHVSSRSAGPTSRLAGCCWPWRPASPSASPVHWPWRPAIGPCTACRRRRRSPPSWRPPATWPPRSNRRTHEGWSSWCEGSARCWSDAGRRRMPPWSRPRCLFRDHCTGVTWERDTGQNFALWSLFQMGQVARAPPALDRPLSARPRSGATFTPPRT